MKLPILFIAPSLLLFASLGSAQPPQPAQPDPSEDDVLVGPARELFEKGKQDRLAERFPDCYAHALAAWKLDQRAGVAGLLGDCALHVGKPREAAEHIRFFLDHLPPKAGAELVAYQERRYLEAKKQIAIVELVPNVPAAKLTADDKPVTATRLYLDPGSHTFGATADQHRPATVTLDLAADTERQVALDLVPLPTTPPPNGDQTATTLPIVVPIVLGAVAVAGLGVGGGLWGAKSSEGDTADEQLAALRAEARDGSCRTATPDPRCAQIADALDAEQSLETGAIGALAAGAVLGATAAVLAVLSVSGESDQSSRPRVIPSVTANSGAVTVELRF